MRLEFRLHIPGRCDEITRELPDDSQVFLSQIESFLNEVKAMYVPRRTVNWGIFSREELYPCTDHRIPYNIPVSNCAQKAKRG